MRCLLQDGRDGGGADEEVVYGEIGKLPARTDVARLARQHFPGARDLREIADGGLRFGHERSAALDHQSKLAEIVRAKGSGDDPMLTSSLGIVDDSGI